PLVEAFMGLSCPSSMGPDELSDSPYSIVQEEDPSDHFTTVVFHELNGGGVEELSKEDSEYRMRYYQPGVAGTPDIEIDGGYIELGGFTSYETQITRRNLNNAIVEAVDRSEHGPPEPVDVVNWSFPYIYLDVTQVFNDGELVVTANVEYKGNARSTGTPDLNGSVTIFIVEDDVKAYSKVYDKKIECDRVFRGYVLKDKSFLMKNRGSQMFSGNWSVPDGVVAQNLEAVVGVFDRSDTESFGTYGGNYKGETTRCIQSGSPSQTTSDRRDPVPSFGKTSIEDGKVSVELKDDEGIERAVLFYSLNGSRTWEYVDLELEQIRTDKWIGTIDLNVSEVYTQVLIYNTHGSQTVSTPILLKEEVFTPSTVGEFKEETESGVGVSVLIVGVSFFVLALVLFIYSQKREREIWKFFATKRTLVLFILVSIVISLVGYGLSDMTLTEKDVEKAPVFDVIISGWENVTNEDYAGKVLVLFIMSTDCAVCNRQMSDLVQLHEWANETYGNDVELLSVSVSSYDSFTSVELFQEKYGAQWAIGRDRNMIENYDVEFVPMFVIIAPNGDVASEHYGERDLEDMKKEVTNAHDGDYGEEKIDPLPNVIFICSFCALVPILILTLTILILLGISGLKGKKKKF
ncbi:MAG: TlpA family protein disulfide reductase, partial [Thermoplasmata archaeon]|nr:TlpA family protein disulfide reductase [Thermoplasmata archaeon]